MGNWYSPIYLFFSISPHTSAFFRVDRISIYHKLHAILLDSLWFLYKFWYTCDYISAAYRVKSNNAVCTILTTNIRDKNDNLIICWYTLNRNIIHNEYIYRLVYVFITDYSLLSCWKEQHISQYQKYSATLLDYYWPLVAK